MVRGVNWSPASPSTPADTAARRTEFALWAANAPLAITVSFGLALSTVLTRPLAFMPEVEEPRLFVHVPFPNATPEQCERLIARPLKKRSARSRGS